MVLFHLIYLSLLNFSGVGLLVCLDAHQPIPQMVGRLLRPRTPKLMAS